MSAARIVLAVAILAAIIPAAAAAAAFIDRSNRRRAQAAEIYRRAAARGAGHNPDDRFAATREQAHACGLPWIESDGAASWPAHEGKAHR